MVTKKPARSGGHGNDFLEGSSRGSADGVEDANFGPVFFFEGDKFVMARGVLIDIVGSSVVEYDNQGDVEFEVIHRPVEVFFEGTGEKEAGAGMVCQVFVTGMDQSVDFFLRLIFQREIDVVCEHGESVSQSLKTINSRRIMGRPQFAASH
jgi:hypothetical protein